MVNIIIIADNAPQCPLCGKRMREFVDNGITYYACAKEFCMISIRTDDPCVGKWNEKPENAPKCPLCKEPMKMFFRAIDRFTVCQCRNEAHRFFQIKKGDATYLPPLEDTAPHG